MKVGLIGINSVQEEEHFLIIQNALHKQLSAIYSPNAEDVIPISKKYNVSTSISVSDLFKQVDAVYFANSLKINYDFAVSALKNSCHLFLEDISELSLESIKLLYKVAFEAGKKIQIKLTKCFTPEYMEVKDWIEEPQIVEITKSFPSFLRDKDYYFEILNNLNFANQKISSTIKKIYTKVLPLNYHHYGLIHINISYDNGAMANIKLNNIADEEESEATFYESDKNTKIDFVKHFSVKLQFENGDMVRKEYQAKKDSDFQIEMQNFINACKNFDPQSISEHPTELKIIQTTENILEQIKNSQKSF